MGVWLLWLCGVGVDSGLLVVIVIVFFYVYVCFLWVVVVEVYLYVVVWVCGFVEVDFVLCEWMVVVCVVDVY